MSKICVICNRENKDEFKFCGACGTRLEPEFDREVLKPDSFLGKRYRILSLIKQGGMGAIYKAVDGRLNHIVAVKELLQFHTDSDAQEKANTWFKREANILANLNHSNLPAVTDYFLNNGRYYLVMTFVDGEDLDSILTRDGKPGLHQDRVVSWAKQILKVLDYLHSQNPPVIYRDIKPSNIMIHRDGRVMLIDFGLARQIYQDNDEVQTMIGTPNYSPIEQFQGKAGSKSDLYALGATMHHLLTGIEPLPLSFEKLTSIVPDISPGLENIVMKALEDNLNNRYNTANDMLKDLNNL